MLLLCFVAAHLIGRQMGWWGPFFSAAGPLGSAPFGQTGGGGRSGGAGSGRGRTRSSGTLRSGGSAGHAAGRGVGNAVGWGQAHRDARRDGRTGDGSGDEPPRWGTWREAVTDGWAQGKERGRERYDLGQQRKAERGESARWWDHARERSGFQGHGRGPVGRFQDHVERRKTCPGCGHGNVLNESRAACPCPREDCACGDDTTAPVTREDEDTTFDFSRPADEDQARTDAARTATPEPEPAVDEPPAAPRVAPVVPMAKPDPACRRCRRPDSLHCPGCGTCWPGDTCAPGCHADPDEVEAAADAVQQWQTEHDPELSDAAPAPGATQHDSTEDPMSAPTAPTAAASGEMINLDSARTALTAIGGKMSTTAERMTEVRRDAEEVLRMCDSMIDGLSALDMDPETLADIAALREQAQQALKEAQEAETHCTESAAYSGTVIGNINTRHGAIEEAVRGSKHAAQIDAYKAA